MSGTRKSITMLENTGVEMEVIGKSIKADSFYGYTDGMHTIQFSYHNFVGGLGIQGTLSLNPKEEDWFYIELRGIPDYDKVPLLQFPKDPLRPTGKGSHMANHVGDTGIESRTFVGNFTYLRAVVTREYLNPMPNIPSDGTWSLGQVNSVLICL